MAREAASSSKKKSSKITTIKAVTNSKPVSSLISGINMLKGMPLVGIILAEFLGTFLLVASILAVQGSPLFVAFALVGVVLIVSGTSSVHLNPAMTIGALVTRKIKPVYAIGYILAQILGAVVAWLVLDSFLRGTESASAFTSSALFHTAKLTEGKEWYILFTELLGTIVLTFGFASALKAKKDKLTAAVSYGFATLVAIIIAGSVTSMYLTESNTGLTFLNPATVIAANGLSWDTWPIAIYIVAPVLGAMIGFVLHDFIQAQPTESKN